MPVDDQDATKNPQFVVVAFLFYFCFLFVCFIRGISCLVKSYWYRQTREAGYVKLPSVFLQGIYLSMIT